MEYGGESCRSEGDVKSDAGPVHVGAVEGRVPGEDDTRNAKGGGHDDVGPATDGLTVEGCVLGRRDAGGDQEADPRVIDACKALHEGLFRDAAHSVPHAAADQAFGGGSEEDGCEEDVSAGGLREINGGRVEIEGDGEDDEEADSVGPDVDEFIVEVEGGADALNFGAGEAVAPGDMWVYAPWVRKVFVS